MKIYFYVAQQQNKGFIPRYVYTKTNTLREANTIVKGALDKYTYALLKALEDNKDFVDDVLSLRKKFDVPDDGFTLEEWDVAKNENPIYKGSAIQREALQVFVKKYNIPSYLRKMLKYIVVGGFVFVPLKKIEIELPLVPEGFEDSVFMEPDVVLRIQGNVSKNYLINFITEHWREIKRGLSLFGDEKDIYISDRDREILRLRDVEKLKFSEIAELLAERTNDFDINEDMIKKAYHRMRDKIDFLTK